MFLLLVFTGIQRYNAMSDKLMTLQLQLHNTKWLKSLDTQLSESTSRNSMKLRKVFKPTNEKTYYF